MIEPEFTEEQIKYIQKIFEEETSKIIDNIQNNSIPKKIVEGMLKVAKEQKLKCDMEVKEVFIDGIIFAFEILLNEEVNK